MEGSCDQDTASEDGAPTVSLAHREASRDVLPFSSALQPHRQNETTLVAEQCAIVSKVHGSHLGTLKASI